MLEPANLRRYDATWHQPSAEVAHAVERYWHVRWSLPEGESIQQRILASPGITLTLESGDVPGPLVITGVYGRTWMRTISGSGEAFGIRLRPAGMPLLSSIPADAVADATVVLTPDRDPGLHTLLAGIRRVDDPAHQAELADEALRAALAAGAAPDQELLLANRILDHLTGTLRDRTGNLAAELGVSERATQRALKRTLGRGPKWVSRWVRLQEVARVLSIEPSVDLAALAVELGYVDQAHLTNDFRRATDLTPGEYARSLRPMR